MSVPTQVIVVGGGLAGLSAAHTILERGGTVLLLDKNPFLGGNSTKATSGINGALTRQQIKLGIKDSPDQFLADTAKSATGGKESEPSDLAKVLIYESAPAVEWLGGSFKLDLSLISRLGGHTYPRTHRGKERFPGMTITYALMEKLEEIAKTGKARIVVEARVNKLLSDSSGIVTGVQYVKDGKTFTEYGPVVIATGGFGADFGEGSLLAKLRPDLLHLPTTNGDHCTGDGMKMGMEIGAKTVDMPMVQVHPTGLVHPDEPNSKLKFLAAEALRGVGGLLLDKDGNRFCNELGTRDYVSGEMWKNNNPPFRLILNSAGGKEIEWHCKHYQGRGLMKLFENGAALAKDMGIPEEKLSQIFQQYNDYAKNQNDPFAKKFFQNMPFDMNDSFWAAIVCPVVHYCMGGLQITTDAEVVSMKGTPIPGLFAAGEVTGGVHGNNRLGGSSLLDCVVYGRVAGQSASRYLMSNALNFLRSQGGKRVSSVARQIGITDAPFNATISQGGVQTRVSLEPETRKLNFEINWDAPSAPSAPAAATSTSTPAAAAPAPKAVTPRPKNTYTLADVAKHNTEKDCWVVVNGEVLDVTNFLNKHPGGKKAILLYAGKDATEEFNMLHKPDVVEKYAPDCIIGNLAGSKAATAATSAATPSAGAAPSLLKALTPGSAKVSPSSAVVGPPPSSTSVTTDFTKPNNTISLKPIQATVPSETPSRNSGGTVHILPQERAKASFTVEKLINVLDGGEKATARRRFIISPSEGTDASHKYYLDRGELMKDHLKHFIAVHDKFLGNFVPTRQDVAWMQEYAMNSGTMMNHWGLFLPTIMNQSSDDQVAKWLPRAATLQIVGCYAQTELGHGSNVRGLQTIAVYDRATDEFVLNTPTLLALKWWPGTLGKLSTHAMVYAQLIIDGKEYGVHVFFCQIRDENHRPLPGIEVGDLGPKLGDHANDTGFMRLENVRIPRWNMLSRHQKVTREGKYEKSLKKTNDKMHYATMMFARGHMVKLAGGILARAVTVATRYSLVRKQGFVDTKQGISFKTDEFAVIDYQMQRYRIFKQLALAYAMKMTGGYMLDRFKEIEKEGAGVISDTAALPEIAATAAGLKAYCTFLTAQGIEDCRKCCGGNGYLLNSGIAALAADYVWQTTAEGDFIILMLQTARFLMRSLQGVQSGKEVSGPCSYMLPVKDPNFSLKNVRPAPAKTVEDMFNLDYLAACYNYRALASIIFTGKSLQQKIAKGKPFDEAWNSLHLQLCDSVKAHCSAFMLGHFINQVQGITDAPLKKVLSRVCVLYALSNIQDEQWAGLGAIGPSQMKLVRLAVAEVLDLLRPEAAALVDAFDFPDRVLNSTLGRFDGNVYEALYDAALKSQLNRVDPFDGYYDVIRPRLDINYLKRGNASKSSKKSKI